MKTEWTVVRVTFMQVVTNLCSRRNHQGDGTCFHSNYHFVHCEAFSTSSQCNYYPIHWYGLEQSNKFKMSSNVIICEYICTFVWQLDEKPVKKNKYLTQTSMLLLVNAPNGQGILGFYNGYLLLGANIDQLTRHGHVFRSLSYS